LSIIINPFLETQMNIKHSLFILLLSSILLTSCVTLEWGVETTPTTGQTESATAVPQIVTVEVPRIVRETQIVIVTVEVPHIVRETQIVVVTVEVPRIIQETAAVTPIPPNIGGVGVSQGVDLGLPRMMHTATRLDDGRILLAGGSNGMDEHYALVEIFDPVSGLFTQAAPLHTARHEHSATLLWDNRVLVVGGYNAQQQWLENAEVYDPSTDTWTVMPPIYSHGVMHTATLLPDGRVLVVGGCIGSGVCTNRAEIFDPQTNSWTEATPLAAVRAGHAAVLLDDGRVLVAGGAPDDSDALLYDPLANTWTATGPMVWRRTQIQGGVKLLDGRVLVAGGLDLSDTPEPMANTEIYDPATNTWTAATSLAQPRYAHSLDLLPDGQVLIVGGAHEYDYPSGYPNQNPWSTTSFVQEIESYDPQTDRWNNVGWLPQPVTYAAAVFLPDGRLWVTGGGAGHAITTAWANTWLITPLSAQP
jgi:N-acetylneuraminic acid mutarotase